MKYISLFFLLFTTSINAQIGYEQGYIIDNEDNKIQCYIKNSDWSTSPDKIYYKLKLDSDVQEATVSDLKGFNILNTEHYYKRFNLSMDRSAYTIQNTNVRELKYKNIVVLLKVLVEGKGNLYEYSSNYIFFYGIDDNSVKQLEYKKYINQKSIKKENKDYQKELYENLKCESFTTRKLVKVDYKRKDLIKLFSEYNECQGSEYKLYQINKTPLVLSFSLSFGLSSAALESNYAVNTIDAKDKFDSQIIFVPGIDFELLLPYQKNKWAIFIGANYQSYEKSTEEVELMNTNLGDLSFEYSYIEIPMGVKHYMYLNSDLKLFLSAAYTPILHLSSNNEEPFIKRDNIQGDISFDREEQVSSAFILGLGCKFKNKYSIGFNYYSSKQINNSEGFSNNMDGSFSLIASYTLF